MERIILCTIFLFSSCAQKTIDTKIEEYSERYAGNTEFTIRYTIGDDIYHYHSNENRNVEVTRNDTMIEKEEITLGKYHKILSAIEKYVRKSKNKMDEFCRGPYRVNLKLRDYESEYFSCRSRDKNGELGRLIREIEILLYTK